MTPEQIHAFYPLANTVRSLFHRMGAAATALHADTGTGSEFTGGEFAGGQFTGGQFTGGQFTGGLRGVLESVVTGGPQTVPEMARARPVTRQHIQGLVNELKARGLVADVANPAHKRSRLIRATAAGEAAYAALRAREAAALAALDLDLDAAELRAARRTLERLTDALAATRWPAAHRADALTDD